MYKQKPFICFEIKERLYLRKIDWNQQGITFKCFIHHSETGFCGGETFEREFWLLPKKQIQLLVSVFLIYRKN